MRRHLKVRHVSEYHYAEPVRFGRHRMMFRPRDSHSLRLLSTNLAITPTPERIRWIYDVFGNSVAFAEFGDQRADALTFVSEIEILHYEATQSIDLLLKTAERIPFAYAPEQLPDLQPTIMMHRPDDEGRVTRWAEGIAERAGHDTLAALTGMMTAIKEDLTYQRRPKSGTQDPAHTLEIGTGSCRDFALLMIEGLRSLGLAARFVSGYLYKPKRIRLHGVGSTHAWLQVYLPGCGWIEMDPTNGILGNRDLIRIAVARDHRQALPLSGSYVGTRSAFTGMTVTVDVTDVEGASDTNSLERVG